MCGPIAPQYQIMIAVSPAEKQGPPPMTEKTLTLEEAEAQLLALEKPSHDVALANSALRRAEQDGDTAAIKAALEKYRAAVEAQDKANVPPIEIARAAQLVLDLRGEAHSELN